MSHNDKVSRRFSLIWGPLFKNSHADRHRDSLVTQRPVSFYKLWCKIS